MKSNSLEKYLSKDQVKKDTGISVHERAVSSPSPLHWHNFIELELILSGKGDQILNGQRFPLSRGCLSVMRHTDFHQVVPTKELRLLNFMIDDRLLSEEILQKLSSLQTMFYRLSDTEYTEFEYLLRLCMTENQKPLPNRRYLKHLIICVFLRAIDLSKEKVKFVENRPIQTALLYMHMHFRENPTLSDVAKIAHYNASHFSTTFHRETGSTYCDYLNGLKIAYAKELLLSTSIKISEICFECGFTSHSNFLRLFKKNTGLSPEQFRKRAIDKNTPLPL